MSPQPFESAGVPQTMQGERVRQFLLHVYNWMSFGLAVTAVIALWVYHSEDALYWLQGHPFAFYGLLIAELILVVAFSASLARVSYTAALAMFVAYAALNGLTFSVLFLVYTAQSIASAFFVTAGTFAGVSLYGMVTKRNLSGVGHFMGMALWGLIVAIVVNLFVGSSALSFWISVAAVIIFVGLTAYDTQRLRQIAEGPMEGDNAHPGEMGEQRKKIALHGALILYLDFINLFIHMLRLMGNRR